MPDSMYADITIGGEISSDLLLEMCKIIEKDFWDGIDIPTSIEELRKNNEKVLLFSAECNDYTNLVNFCKENKLTCVVEISPDTNWNRGIIFTHNGSESLSYDADDQSKLLHSQNQIKPLFHLLLDYAKNGIESLPLHISNTHVITEELAMEGLKDPDNFLDIFQKKIEELFQEIPEVPLFIIK